VRARFLLVLLALTGCATVRTEPQAYVETFRAEGRARGVEVAGNIEVVLVTTLGGPAGRCYPEIHRVLIARDFWDNTDWSEPMRREAVFHELGHCLLRLPHEEGHRAGLMAPELLPGLAYAEREPFLLDRLFAARAAR
jgi:hypothetical protein